MAGVVQYDDKSVVCKYYDDIIGEWIPDNEVVLITTESGTVYSFNIHTLVKTYTLTGKLDNPYTRGRLSDDVIYRITSYMQVKLVYGNGNTITFNGATQIYKVLLKILSKLLGNKDLCVSHDVLVDNISLYTYDMMDEIAFIPITSESRIELLPHTNLTSLNKLVSALENSQEYNDIMLTETIRSHLRNGDIIWYT